MPPNKIAVVGPGIVGMPMAALLAASSGSDGSTPSRVVVVQRRSPSSGWKVDAINAGRSPIGGVEPSLDRIVSETVAKGALSATHDYEAVSDADVVLVCVQTDKSGLAPDRSSWRRWVAWPPRSRRPNATRPLVIIESTLAPSTMQSIIRPFFASHGLIDGRDVLLGNSPNRVMPGHLVQRVAESDKIVAGLDPATPVLIASLYRRIVTRGRLLVTNSLTAELVKTLENAYRDVRIAFSAEIVRYCDRIDVDFFTLRDQVNDLLASRDDASWNGSVVPTGALLVPTVGVGGHRPPKDGILLWWRALEAGLPSRNMISSPPAPSTTPRPQPRCAWRAWRSARSTAGAPWCSARPTDSTPRTRASSPSLTLAALLRDSGADVIVHDPYVPARDANLARLGLSGHFTSDIESALDGRSVVFLATAHKVYRDLLPRLRRPSSGIEGVIDARNLYQAGDFGGTDVRYAGIGRGRRPRTAHWCAAWRSMAARWRVAWQMRWTPGAVPQPPLRRR